MDLLSFVYAVVSVSVVVGMFVLAHVEEHKVLPFTAKSRGLMARFALSLEWKPMKAEASSARTGKPTEWLRDNEIELLAMSGDEELILADRVFGGYPDPPPYQLWSRASQTDKWVDWGEFDVCPPSWKLPFTREEDA